LYFLRVIKLKSTVAVLREERHGGDGKAPPEGPDGHLNPRKEKSRSREEQEVSKDKKDKRKR